MVCNGGPRWYRVVAGDGGGDFGGGRGRADKLCCYSLRGGSDGGGRGVVVG